MASSINSDSGDMGFQIAPMVDVVFVLLLFFMACAGLRQSEKILSVNIPGRVDNPGVTAPVFVDIDRGGKIAINNRVFALAGQRDLSSLSEWLREMGAVYGQDPVVIRPASDARHERIMEVLSACSEAKVEKVSFL